MGYINHLKMDLQKQFQQKGSILLEKQVECLNLKLTLESTNYYCISGQRIKGNQRLMCPECLLNNRGVLNDVSFKDFIVKIQDVKERVCYEVTNSVENYFGQLDGLINDFRQIKIETFQIIDQMINLISMWKKELDGLQTISMRFSLMEEINNKKYFVKMQRRIYKRLQNNHQIKEIGILKLQKEIKDKNNELDKKIIIIIIRKSKIIIINFLIGFFNHEFNIIFGGQFNKYNLLLVTEYITKIAVWKFENGKLIDQNIKFKLGQRVELTVFSKKNNWFMIGMEQGRKIIFFQFLQLANFQIIQKHIKMIISLILNNKEDLLISSSEDKTINILGVDQIKNSLTFIYSLDPPISWVFQITLSLNETKLVSRSDKLILWTLDNNNKWALQILHAKQIDIQGPTTFINEEILVIGELQKSQITFFKIEKGSFQELYNIEIEIIHKSHINIHSKIIYNSDKQVIIIQFGYEIFILKQLQTGNFILNKIQILIYALKLLFLTISNICVINSHYMKQFIYDKYIKFNQFFIVYFYFIALSNFTIKLDLSFKSLLQISLNFSNSKHSLVEYLQQKKLK
ncbi:unnamed protein product [Paramecium sonneborni]|uniref:Uncharacterized protein n=1 Tax=Paramecium sonneborni TaxID=65129 RepID=A0A8S1PIG3_9CILI|nr:unnamed protein product [Paramecium sonneborni]